MGSFSTCLKGTKAKKSALEQAKLMKKTQFNKRISTSIKKRLVTKEVQQKFCKQSTFKITLLLSGKYSEFTEIIRNLYLTGIGGINADNISSNRIKCIINVTFESPEICIKGIEHIRIPVDDDPKENLSIYFEEVCDLIEKNISHQKRVVVHCLCGISRSTTIIIAYLMKCKEMSLKSAFIRIKERRKFIKPNNGFFQQLIDYERKLFNKTSVNWIKYKTKRGKTITIPDIILQNYPQDLEDEDDEEESIDRLYSQTVSTNLSRSLF